MAINKVVYGNDTLVDLTEDSVSANNLLEGETAHDKSGNPVTGTAKQGHIVQNDSGTDMPQEENLQFVGVYTEDDATNDRTKVNIVRPMTKEQYEALTPAQKKGFIRTTDEPDNPLNVRGYVEVIADGQKSYRQIFDSLRNAIDANKIQPTSVITFGTATNYRTFTLCTTGSSEFKFTNNDIINSKVTLTIILVRVSNSAYVAMNNDGDYSDYSSGLVDSGTVTRLYY